MARVSTFDFSNVTVADMPTIKLSPQQLTIMDFVDNGEGSALIIAVAGAGKTTTLIEALARMRGSVAFCAYNKRIADEIAEKVARRTGGKWVRVNTFHAFGLRAWRKHYPNVEVDDKKIFNLVREIEHTDTATQIITKVPQAMYEFVDKLVSLVRQAGVGIVCPINKGDAWNELIEHHNLEDILTGRKPWEEDVKIDPEQLAGMLLEGKTWALRVLRRSIAMADAKIDFDDMIFMPLYMGVAVEQFDWVLIDEAQDSNVTRRLLAKAMMKPGGRCLAVGDPAQAIYGFTGADSESLDNIKDEFGCIELPLTVSYRCPRAVVNVARRWVSHIEPTGDAPEGRYDTWTQEAWELWAEATTREEMERSVVLCRKNAPLVDIAFDLLRQRIPCHVEGRDIGKAVKDLAKKFRVRFLSDLVSKLGEYEVKQRAKYLAKGRDAQADALTDRCETLRALCNGLIGEGRNDMRDLEETIDAMFADGKKSGITLSSIHKSKGREWSTVYWLGRARWQPSPFARQSWQLEQERNLMYVAATRAQEALIEVVVPEKEQEY